jgi:hypothetical protein
VAQGVGPEFKPQYCKGKKAHKLGMVCTPVSPALRRLRQEHLKFVASLRCIGRPCIKNERRKERGKKRGRKECS